MIPIFKWIINISSLFYGYVGVGCSEIGTGISVVDGNDKHGSVVVVGGGDGDGDGEEGGNNGGDNGIDYDHYKNKKI